ncbi:MAG: flippase-like domain-containing protein [Chloroflexota bacterium]|nr:MAG: flippase-like domain-containing protein [Chloroflexota bacterium]
MSLMRKGSIPSNQPVLPQLGEKQLKIYLKFFVWAFIPLAFWWALKDISPAEVLENFKRIGFQAILVLAGLNVVIFALLSLRWWLILRAQGHHPSFLSLISYRLAGFGVNYFTPGPQFGGEPLQVYLLNQREGLKTSTAAASVSVDKLLELLANFSFLFVGISLILLSGNLAGATRSELIFLPLLLLAFPISYLVALRLGYQPLNALVIRIDNRNIDSSRFEGLMETICETEFQVSEFCLQKGPTLLLVAFLSMWVWALMVLEFNLMARFLGIHLTLIQVLVALTAARIAFLLPLPAGLGSLEAGQVMAMGLIGVNPILGVSLSLLIRVRDVIFGGIGLWLGVIYSRKPTHKKGNINLLSHFKRRET